MTIENPDLYAQSSPDWAILDGCFGGRIKPMDIDGCVERRGRVLFLENKLPGAYVKDGQLYTFHSLVRQGNTVIIFWSENHGRIVHHIRVMSPGRDTGKVEATLEDLRAEVAAWYQRADAA